MEEDVMETTEAPEPESKHQQEDVQEIVAEIIPDVEWWDAPLLATPQYDANLVEDLITIYIEHPLPLAALSEPPPPPPMPLPLTKRERKKISRMRRLEKQKEVQDKIRLGLMPPPEPKVKLSNLMRVLQNEAVADPSAVEAKVRAQAEKRKLMHELQNEKRRLTPEERREKKRAKLAEDTSVELNVAIFKVADLSHAQHRFKVDINAQQLGLTGCAVLFPECNVVVVEGGPKAMKKFNRLMLKRIKWEDVKSDAANEEESDEDEDEDSKSNKCMLVWQGIAKQRAFQGFRFESCRSEAMARKCLTDRGVGQYWDMARAFDADKIQ
eukprot:TRINITY_DN11153_c0_g3_i4.p1 TRINITY_DN11153_c0_g3~~TRINITY_DN11153_c0_g3_i4.p1  ORF type:complete len:325 (+),score=82.83 TRINITY_DN11153_c0_g3_i4:40-1014(+)